MTKARQATAPTSRLARIARRAIPAARAPRAFLPGAKGSGAPSRLHARPRRALAAGLDNLVPA